MAEKLTRRDIDVLEHETANVAEQRWHVSGYRNLASRAQGRADAIAAKAAADRRVEFFRARAVRLAAKAIAAENAISASQSKIAGIEARRPLRGFSGKLTLSAVHSAVL